MKNNKSIVSNTFYGIIRSIMTCEGCKIKKYSFQTFNLLNFVLKKVKEDKVKNLGEFYDGIHLFDAFDSEQKEDYLTDENQIYCNNCKGMRNAYHQQTIYSLPSVLIIILNRGRNNQDFNEYFPFYEKLDFTNRNYIINQNSYKRFYLCGVITHLGESGSSGHFICYCRNNPNGNFICYNDATFSEATVQDATASNISNKSNEKRTPYILFYHYY